MLKRFIYPGFDQAIIEISDSSKGLSPNEVSEMQEFDIKLLNLFLTWGYIVITRTFLQESEATRITMNNNIILRQSGFVRLLTDTVSIEDEILEKQERYRNVRDIEKYNNAYYKREKCFVDYSGYLIEEKDFSSGSLAHALWIEDGRLRAADILMEVEFNDAIKRIKDRDTGNSTWESTRSGLAASGIPRGMMSALHARSFTSYLDSYRHNNFGVIVNSTIAPSVFTRSFPMTDFNLFHIYDFIQTYDLTTIIRSSSFGSILRCRRLLMQENINNNVVMLNNSSCGLLADKISRSLISFETNSAIAKGQSMPIPIERRNFKVAISFSGTSRSYIEDVYHSLAKSISHEHIFYDKPFQAELARPELDLILGNIYRKQSELVVVFISEGYESSNWCGLEWRNIREIIFNKKNEKIMFVKFDDTELDGLLKTDGYIDARNYSPDEVALFILRRAELLNDYYGHSSQIKPDNN